MLERLKFLRDHLYELDSGSDDAHLLAWAVAEIEKLTVPYSGLWFHEKDGTIREGRTHDC